MKQTKILTVACKLMLFVFSSCQKDDHSLIPSGTEASKIIQQGSWRITLYYDCGEDETNHFSGYAITFDSTGKITAANGSFTINGSWNAGTDTIQDEFSLHFNSMAPFDEIDDDCWHIIENTTSRIRLEDECDGVNDKDYLTFEKI
jgi:hypothetical protein